MPKRMLMNALCLVSMYISNVQSQAMVVMYGSILKKRIPALKVELSPYQRFRQLLTIRFLKRKSALIACFPIKILCQQVVLET